jgi:hypothetical protein
MALYKSILPIILYKDKIPFVTDTSTLDEESFAYAHKKRLKVLDVVTVQEHEPIIFYERDKSEEERSLNRKEKQIREAVQKGDIREARKMISEIHPHLSKVLDGWGRALTEPKGTLKGTSSGFSLKPNIVWLKNNSNQYKGQWVALRDGALLGNHANRTRLRAELRRLNKLKGALFVKVEE